MSRFPNRFMWGISMAAFQYEMGASKYALDPNSDWYIWLHDKKNIDSKIAGGDLPEQGPGYWDLYKVDHGWAKWLGLKAWRANPEWSRIFPKPTRDVKVSVIRDDEGVKDVEVNEASLRKLDALANKNAIIHYREIFRDLKARGIKLVLNLYHWPLPLWIHDPIIARETRFKEGPRGWYDEDTVIEFAKFAAYAAWKFQDLVDMWSTINEPNVVWGLGYLSDRFPPGLFDTKAAEQAAFNMAQAHARAYDQIKSIAGKKAKVGVIYIVAPADPLTDSEEDRKAAEAYNKNETRWVKALVKGVYQKWSADGEIKRRDMGSRIDWIGVNYYFRSVVKHVEEPPYYQIQNNYGVNCQSSSRSASGRPTTEMGWEIYPEGIRKALNLFKDFEKPMMVTENGIADFKDRYRSWYLISHLHNILLAIKEDGLNVIGYFHWSLIDNLEWTSGFSKRFGLIYVDMNTKKRTPRPSAYVYRDIIENNALPEYLEEYSKYPNILTEA